ncbi:PQQ-binding-like beta-propeller repeat protein [Halomicroarcula limicola]|uniref:PQQ-binding-like beta-propeller repeat protein n=1 Tax=Haloarcula limicola TaxID=1429915 RepID=A0A8J8C2N8_9EURY|nr:PQQ-binding-like beta-propeller repeat protein [Halomicroarcula limicola]MBV0923307.1 PQQ-binding-like beta-propeller repeat protein [Halomicroarcula limicola]
MNDTSAGKVLALSLAVLAVAAIPAGLIAPIGIGAANTGGNAAGNVGEWPSYQADDRNSGNATGAPDYGSIDLGWSVAGNQGTDVASGPTVGDDTVYVGDGSTVKAYAEADGSQTWTQSVDGSVFGSPTHDEGSLYVATDAGTVYALDTASGTVEWTRSTDSNEAAFGAFAGSVATDDAGALYVASEDGHVYKLAADGSEVLAAYDMGSPAGAMTPAIADGTLYVGDRSGTLHALSTADLSATFSEDVASGALNAPAVTADGQTVVVTATDGTVAAYDATGTEQWAETSAYDGSFASPAIHRGSAVVGTSDAVAAHALGDGTQQWRTSVDTKDTFGASVTTANGTVFVGTDVGDVHLLDATDGRMRASFYASSSAIATAPTVAYDALYVGADTGAVRQFVDANPSISVASISAPDSVERGDTATVTAELSNIGQARGSYTAELTVDGTVVDSEPVDVAAGATETVRFEYTFETTGEVPVSVGSQSTTVTVRSDSSGDGGGPIHGNPDDGTETTTPDEGDGTDTPVETDCGCELDDTPTEATDDPVTTDDTATPDGSDGTETATADGGTAADDGSDGSGTDVPTSGDGPGFTAVAALLAVVAAALLAARREN